ncbi:MAG TPA: FHA domain-containing protein [Thiobacillaceae bacterium]|nr:FHA domain-containing protein [Thiobacillaceae bacterium]
MAKLLITRAGKNPIHFFIEAERVVAGRQEGCALVLDAAGVSKEHAAILTVGNDHILEDLGSTNGTLINGEKVSRHILQNRDLIEIGPFRIQYVNQRAPKGMDFDQTMLFEGESVGDGQEEAPVVETARQRQISGPVGNLRGVKGAAEGKEIDLARLIKSVGRAETQQAAILRRPKGYVVMQVSGKGAVRVNGDAIGEEWRNLAVGDKLEVDGGQYVFELVPDIPASWPKDGL